jgi:hypothetical protein
VHKLNLPSGGASYMGFSFYIGDEIIKSKKKVTSTITNKKVLDAT